MMRIRKNVKHLPQHEWTTDEVMLRVRLTNVQRENDRTTCAMRQLTREQAEHWHCPGSGEDLFENDKSQVQREAWTQKQTQIAGLLVFNCALWRAFGTAEFAMARGFVEAWTLEDQAETDAIAQVLWQNDIAVFTEAYDPARGRHRAEANKSNNDSSAMSRVFASVFKAVTPIWDLRESIAKTAYATGSWKATTQRLMQISGYGGTGFLAKEVVQDLLYTPVFQDYMNAADSPSHAAGWQSVCVDENEWCAVGPGARRGLNRLKGRPTRYCIFDTSPAKEHEFLTELKALFQTWQGRWPKMLLGTEVAPLTLHDVQFQLCEFDKYQRAKHREGGFRPYKPPATKRLSREELVSLVRMARPGAMMELVTEDSLSVIESLLAEGDSASCGSVA